MKVHKNQLLLSIYMDGRLDDRKAAAVSAHIQECSECREMLQSMQKTRNLLADTGKIEPPASLHDDIMENLRGKYVSSYSLPKRILPVLGTASAVILVFLVMRNLPREGLLKPYDMTAGDYAVEHVPESIEEERSRQRLMDEKDQFGAVAADKVPPTKGDPGPPDSGMGGAILSGPAEVSLRRDEGEFSDSFGIEKEAELPATAEKPRHSKKIAEPNRKKFEKASDDYLYGIPGITIIRQEPDLNAFLKQHGYDGAPEHLENLDFYSQRVVVMPGYHGGREYSVDDILEEDFEIIFYYTEKDVPHENDEQYYTFYVIEKGKEIHFRRSE